MISLHITFKTHREKIATAQADFLNIVINVLGPSISKRELKSDYGYYTISTIIQRKYDRIREWFTTNYKLKTTRVGDTNVDRKIKIL